MALFNKPASIVKHRARASASACPTTTAHVLSKAEHRLEKALPDIDHDMCIQYVSAAAWSTHDLVLHLLKTTGPAHLTGATWSVSRMPCNRLIAALDGGQLLSMSFLFDWRIQVRCPEALALARQHSADIRISSCHAKVACLHNETWSIAIVTSANFTNNPRIEAGVIFTDYDSFQFHNDWIMAEIQNAKPFGLDMRKAKAHGNKDVSAD